MYASGARPRRRRFFSGGGDGNYGKYGNDGSYGRRGRVDGVEHWWTTWTGGEWASVGVGMQAAGGGAWLGGGFEI